MSVYRQLFSDLKVRAAHTQTIAAGLAVLALGVTLVVAPPAWGSTGATKRHETTTTQPHKAVAKPAPQKKPKRLPSPHIGQVAKDGDFAFTVTAVQCGVTQVGDGDFGETAPAGSQWCLATMNVKNDKSEGQTFFASNQKAIDDHGNQLSADDAAILYLPNDAAAESSSVNPGVSVSVVVPFQLPTTRRIAKFELHDSAFSGGVSVYNVG